MLDWRRLRFFRGRRDERADIERELRFHIEGRARELEAAGHGKEEAEREAARVFGNYRTVRDACEAVAGYTPRKRERSMTLESIRSDIAFALKSLWKNPGFAAVALITLALGIGANTAIFTVVNAVLLRDLPYHEPDRLAMIWLDNHIQGWPEDVTSYPNYVDLRERNRTLEEVASYRRAAITLTGEVAPERLAAAAVTHTFFPVLGVSPLMGRWFTEEEDQSGNERVVILAEGFWRNRFGGDESIVGKSIVLDDQSYTVVGVMPASFDHPAGMALWMPMAPGEGIRACRMCLHLAQIARMKPGVTLEEVRLDLAGVAARLAEDYPETNARMGFTVNPLLDQLVRDVRTALWVLAGTVGFVLLIACANIANLLLARGAARESEVAVRAALGASRSRLFRQLLTESLVLATIGVPLGILIARVGIGAMSVVGSSRLPRMGEVSMSGEVMLFTAVVGVFAAVLFGLMPAVQSSRLDVNAHLKEGGRSGGRNRRALRRGLVIAEVALACVLLVGGGLLMRSFAMLQDEDIGLSTDNLITLSLSATGLKYQAPGSVLAFFADIQESLRALPGVTRVGASTERVTGGSAGGGPFIVEGKDLFTRDSYVEVRQNRATPDFFRAAGVPLISGRTFNEFDRAESEMVVVISESMARRFWPDEDAIGSRIAYDLEATENTNWRTVVGVVGDVRGSGLVTDIQPATYLPLRQAPTRSLTLAIRMETEPTDLFASIRQAVWDIDPNMPIPTLTTMEDVVANRIRARRFNTILLATFAGVAFALAIAGVYGVMSYTVSQWTHDIGLRLALGAQRADVLKMVIADGAKMAGVGLVFGLAGAMALSRLMSGMLFGVTPFDPATLVMAALVLGMTALLASYLPALRAMRIDSLSALRCE